MNLAAIESSLRQAIGRRQVVEDHITASAVERLAVTLESSAPIPRGGDPLPCGWHTIFCQKAPARADLGEDGLPQSFNLIPPVPMQRRLLGGARVSFHQPLMVGEPVRCESELVAARTRSTAGAHLAIATLRHSFSGAAGVAVIEDQDIIHMEPIAAGSERPSASVQQMSAPTWERRIVADSVMLFRFSAVTFNSHRIHYDVPYTLEAEKQPGLIVQGKLIALQLIETVRIAEPRARLERFEYRSGRPLFAGAPCTLKGKLDDSRRSASLRAEDGGGQVVQSATVAFTHPVGDHPARG